nr:MAG TPA: hypothetical protein [Inoviridae sp.]
MWLLFLMFKVIEQYPNDFRIFFRKEQCCPYV